MDKLQLRNVTIIAVAGNKQAQTIAAIYKSISKVDFGAVKLITNINISCSGIEVIKVDGLNTWAEYNRFIVKELHNYFTTDYCLIVQHDSWVLNSDIWNDEWLWYDYIGAKGLSDGRNNYNGGFSLRSKRFQQAIAKDDFIDITAPEDEVLCRLYRSYIEKKYGFKYCTEEIADLFSFELHEPLQKTFGFHNFYYEPYKETVVVKRSYALGDVIMCEPILHYFHKNGFNVALDTTHDYANVYASHYFPIKAKASLNPKLKYREVDLDMAYEITPKRSVLESYYEVAGIENEPLRNSVLTVAAWGEQKIFKKYCLIHIDDTGLEYRNQYGINWRSVVMFLQDKGYLVFQIGKRVEKEIAPYLNTYNLQSTMFIIKGADLFIGLDSGCAQIAVGLGIPSVIFFGSVNPNLRYNDFSKISVVQSQCPIKEKENCYHEEPGGTVGSKCIVDEYMPPCATYTNSQVINAIKIQINANNIR